MMQNWLLYDCGSIYVNGVNGGSEIAHNYCLNQTQLFGALYPDEGSSLWSIHDNGRSIALLLRDARPKKPLTLTRSRPKCR